MEEWLNKFIGEDVDIVYPNLILRDISFRTLPSDFIFSYDKPFFILTVKDKIIVEVIEKVGSFSQIQDKLQNACEIILAEEVSVTYKLSYDNILNYRWYSASKAQIFVSVVSYRDNDLRNTLVDLFQKASHPDSIRVYCLDQRSEEDAFNIKKDDCIFDNYNIDFDVVDSRSSKGVCWARNYAQSKYQGETYFLQIDSHMRFVKSWDDKMIDELVNCNDEKGVISCYPPHFNPKSDADLPVSKVYTKAIGFADNGSLVMQGRDLSEIKNGTGLINHGWISAGFFFTYGRFIEEVKYDPYLYFQGEETDISIKAFSKGWKSFAPDNCLIWHYYFELDEAKRIRHWDDQENWGELSRRSDVRIKHKLGVERVSVGRQELVNITINDIYKKESLVKFGNILGVSFRNKVIY